MRIAERRSAQVGLLHVLVGFSESYFGEVAGNLTGGLSKSLICCNLLLD